MDLSKIDTEQRNPDTMNIDAVPTFEMLEMINREDGKVAEAVAKILPQITKAVDSMSTKFIRGGRIVYVGAGTSGRLGFLDAAESVPTFGIEEGRITGLIAGGPEAMRRAVEGAEDNTELCEKDLKNINFSAADVLVGLAASGRTPYVIGGMNYARSIGAVTVSVTCNPAGSMNSLADCPIVCEVGPEVITGSTRMKSGTAQKMILNMMSTAIMIKDNKVFSNLMVNVQPTNGKLRERAKRIVMEITGAAEKEVGAILIESGYNVPVSIVALITGVDKEAAEKRLKEAGDNLRRALHD
ncbi:N-acetylmuramic acid 6-phosphate etherase [Sporolactobacillus shoreae]|uniref:N-acetylmuramic acid 6-phosphate etherase n=1 Tax=Sporolactobacillus shoreae TaxID=1465501 RepID=A0A4Z0GS62_9BACL|nr:N-acetylmuramic acid 6-phosphate etherase [Sporolactobacillus shoreae]TGA99746.1 N-acetylmuramic acid 6-phosphate etherase [Sporolactobacillus shoreae]